MIKQDLKTIDIVPLIESAGNIGGIISAILGVILIIIGIILIATVGAYLITAGISLLGAGVVALLSKPPSSPTTILKHCSKTVFVVVCVSSGITSPILAYPGKDFGIKTFI
jgi:predicted phage tail protein